MSILKNQEQTEEQKQYTEEEAAALMVANMANNIKERRFNYLDWISDPERMQLYNALKMAAVALERLHFYKDLADKQRKRADRYEKIVKELRKELKAESDA